MAHTGLGVGNREGVYVMLTGTLMAIVGMIYAFYVKPVIHRGRRSRALADVLADETAAGSPKKRGETCEPEAVRA